MRRWSAVVCCALVATTAWAGEKNHPGLEIAKPFITDETFVIGYFDVEKLNLKPGLALLEKAGVPKQFLDDNPVSKAQLTLIAAGAKKLLLIGNQSEQMDEWLVILPVGKDAKVDEIGQVFQPLPNWRSESKEGLVFVGSEAALGGLAQRQSKVHADLRPAFQAIEGKGMQLVVLAPKTLFGKLEDALPFLPGEVGGAATTTLTRGLRWLAIGADDDLIGKKIVAQTKDPQAARDIQKIADSFIELINEKAFNSGWNKTISVLRPDVEDDRLVVQQTEKQVSEAFQEASTAVKKAARRLSAQNQLRMIGLAMHNFHDTNTHLPQQGNGDKKALLSWRVHLLPYLDQAPLYQKFKLDEPWDSDHNKKLIDEMPDVFKSENSKAPKGKTLFLGVAGKQMIFHGTEKRAFRQVTDGTSNTIAVVEADDAKAVFWTQPEDFTPDQKEPMKGLVRKDATIFSALMLDGSVRAVSATIRAETLWALFTMNGNEVIGDD